MRIASHFRLLRCITPWHDGRAVFEAVPDRTGQTDTTSQFVVKLFRSREESDREAGVLRKLGKHSNVIELSAALPDAVLLDEKAERAGGGSNVGTMTAGSSSVGTITAGEGEDSDSSKVCALAFPFIKMKENGFSWVAASPDRIRSFLRQLLQALQHVHSTTEMAHFDVKPSNLLVSTSDDTKTHPAGVRVVLTDFGSTDYSEPGATTPGYTAFEVLQMWQAGPLSDVWSAGVVFAELLMAGRLFPEVKCDHTELKAIMDMPHDDEYGLLIADRIPKDRLGTVVSEAALDLCSKMLRRGTYNRISADEALEHPYFSER